MTKQQTQSQDQKVWKCKRKGCKYNKPGKMNYQHHVKRTCLQNKIQNSKALNFDTLDLQTIQISDKIGQGFYGNIYEAKIGNFEVVVKFNNRLQNFQIENFANSRLHEGGANRNFPLFFGNYQTNYGKILIFQRLNFSLSDLLQKIDLTDDQVYNLFALIVQRLKQVHQKGICHRDLKSNNIMINKRKVFIIDFGCSKIFNPKRIKLSQGSVFGSLRFMSIDSHKYMTQTPKDDLQNIGFILIDILKGMLPWDLLNNLYKKGQLETKKAMTQIKKMKQQYAFQQFPIEMKMYFDHVRSHKNELPDYDHLISLLKKLGNNKQISTKRWDQFSVHFPIKKVKKGIPIKNFIPENTDINTQNEHQFQVYGFDEGLLPTNLFQQFLLKNWLTKTQIVQNLSQKGIIVGKDFVCFDTKFEIDSKTEERIIQSPIRVWLFHFNHGIDEQHFAVYLSNGTQLISFNGLTSYEPKSKLIHIKPSKFNEIQRDSWSCGFRSFHWIYQICSFGVNNWILKKQLCDLIPK